MKALIASGGRGTRLRPLTHTSNKHLIPIANKPILHYSIEAMRDAGIREIGIVINAGTREVPEAIGDGKAFGVRITYIPQEKPSGLANVVQIAESFIAGEPFIFYLGDNMVVGGVRRFIEEFERQHCNCFLTLARVRDPERFGVPEIRNDRIVAVEEKPRMPKSSFAVAGIYLYDKTIFEAVNNIRPGARGEYEISDAHQYLLDHHYTIGYAEITGWWKDTGKPSDLLEANRLVLDNIPPRVDGTLEDGSDIAGRVIVEPTAVVRGSRVRGPAIIGAGCLIENSYIGPYTSIGEGTRILNSEVEYSIVMKECSIQNVNIRIESSILGNDVEIVEAGRLPRTHRFMIGDQSRVEVV